MPIERRRVVYITPDDDVVASVLDMANAATASLHLLVYGFTIAALGDVLIAKHQAGLQVGVVADKSQSAGPTQHQLLAKVLAAGVPVTITTSPKAAAIQHNKVMLVDAILGPNHNDSFVCYGSLNLSNSGPDQANHWQSDNDPAIVARFWQEYQDLEVYGKAHVAQLGAP